MTWVQLLIALPVAWLVTALVADFFAGLSEQRLWSDPAVDDPQSLRFRELAADAHRRTAVPEVEKRIKQPECWDRFVPVPQS